MKLAWLHTCEFIPLKEGKGKQNKVYNAEQDISFLKRELVVGFQ
jgi:hypothetical protein